MSDKGFIEWKPQKRSREMVEMMQAILDEYRESLPLTNRQIFYRAVGQYGYEKTEQAYKRMGYISTKARRAGLIPWSHIRDDGVTIRMPYGFRGVEDFRQNMLADAKSYRRHRQMGQPRRIMLLCEAAGMVPQLVAVADPYGVEVRSSGGYDSVTAKYDLACAIIAADMPVTLLHLGDLDPSGEDIFANIRDDVGAFVEQMTVVDAGPHGAWREGGAEMEAVRIAVTREQAKAMDLPTAPAKPTDSRSARFDGETVQCEAIPPNVLHDIVEAAIRDRIDDDTFGENLRAETEEASRIVSAMAEIRL